MVYFFWKGENKGLRAGEGIILKKDKNGKVIGIEKLYVSKTVGIDRPLPVELVVA